jgi:branched-chain amino acid transport system substrate-binding protein
MTIRALSIAAAMLATSTLGGQVLAQGKDPIRIGVPTALTGAYADLGNQAKRAIELAIEEANAAGGVDGRKVEARFLDTEAKADLARAQGEKLALSGYNLLIATIASGEGLALGPQLGKWDALYISTINKANAITGASCNARMFRVNHLDKSDAAVVKPWLATRKEAKWAVIGMDGAWGRDSAASFKSAAEPQGKQIISESFSPLGTSDYAPYIQKITESGAQGLWVALAGRDAINFAAQAKQFGLFDKVFVAGTSFVTDSTVKAMGDISKGIWGIVNYSSSIDTPQNKAFVAAWTKKYPGTWPTNFEGETYLGMRVLFDAVKKAGSVKPADVAKAMSGTKFDTLYGPAIMRKEDHQLELPNYFGQIQDIGGRLQPVATMTIPAEQATPKPDGSCKF